MFLSCGDALFDYFSAPLENLAQDWMRRGMRLIIVTKGNDGAIGFTNQGVSAAVAGVHVNVVDTIGAGDTFQAAALAWLERHDALSGAKAADLDSDALSALLSFGARAAAIICGRRGADLPTGAELKDVA